MVKVIKSYTMNKRCLYFKIMIYVKTKKILKKNVIFFLKLYNWNLYNRLYMCVVSSMTYLCSLYKNNVKIEIFIAIKK
jgi:hypothetical protein